MHQGILPSARWQMVAETQSTCTAALQFTHSTCSQISVRSWKMLEQFPLLDALSNRSLTSSLSFFRQSVFQHIMYYRSTRDVCVCTLQTATLRSDCVHAYIGSAFNFWGAAMLGIINGLRRNDVCVRVYYITWQSLYEFIY